MGVMTGDRRSLGYRSYIGFQDIPLVMENQAEHKLDNQMESGLLYRFMGSRASEN